MDQLKAFWAGIVKYHFWILTSIALLSSLGAFYAARSALDENVKSRIGKLDNAFRTVSNLSAEAPKHPNASSEKEMDAILNKVSMNVKDAWSQQYERQRDILKWDLDVVKNEEVFKMLDSYRPIENFLDFPLREDKISVTYRDAYRNYVKNLFPKLASIIGAHWSVELGSASALTAEVGSEPSATGASSPTIRPLVNWSSASQAALQSSIVPWYNPNTSPSTLDICYTQEDIWILEGILQVIKATNGNAKENFQAPIKEVEWIRIGKHAGSSGASVAPVGSFGGGDSSEEMGVTAVAATSTDPADNRYVDSNYDPVPGARLRAAMKSATPEDAFFAVAKRVPVRFRVKMDQSKQAKLLAECGNANLMIEVKQVRINAPEGASSISVGGSSGFGGAFGAGESGMESEPLGGEELVSSGFGGGGGAEAAKTDPPVEVYGIVYLFNPVDFNKLGLEKVTENTTLVTTASPTTATPAATVAPPEVPNAGDPVEPSAAGSVNPSAALPAAAPPAAESAPPVTPPNPSTPPTSPPTSPPAAGPGP